MVTRRDTPFREAMTSLLVFDGAMGSLLYERGVFVTQNFEQLNVTRPDVVRKIHEDYVAAGAQVIETNTFGANCFLPRPPRARRPGARVQRGGARLARQAAGDDVWVAGSVGPSGLVPGVATKAELDLVFTTFAEQAAALVEGGADLLILETFRHLEELRIALEAAHQAAPGIPIIASMAFDPTETVADGSAPEHVATTLRDWGADALGVNCGDGPQIALAIAERMRGAGLPLCVQPNAGLPRTVDGRVLYMGTPEYFDVFARRTSRSARPWSAAAAGRRPSTCGGWRNPVACSATGARTSPGRVRRGPSRPRPFSSRRHSPSGAPSRPRSRRASSWSRSR